MSQRNDSSRYGANVNQHTNDERIRDERVPDPYEGQRSIRRYGAEQVPPRWSAARDDDFAHEPLTNQPSRSTGLYEAQRATSPWEELPARYGGGYRDDEGWSPPPRGQTTEHGGYRHPPGPDERNRYGRGQSNSGYRMSDHDLGERANEDRFEAPAEYGATRDPSLSGRYETQGRGYYGAQGGRPDTYGSAGYRQQGKRYWFDESGQQRGRGTHQGVGPRGYVRSDERLRELVCERLTEADIDASDIEVTVSDGVVTLEGSVPDRRTRHAAEDHVDECGGVKDIQNHLRVGRGRSDAPSGAASGAGTPPATPGTSGGDGEPTTRTH